VVSEAFARRYWPGEDPLGRELCFCWGGDSAQVVVGVVGDIRHDGLDQVDEGTVYMSHAQNGRAELNLFVRVDGAALSVVDDVRREVAALDPLQPLGDVAALSTVLRDSVSDRSSLLTVVGFFGLAALLLAAVGIYAVTAQSAGRRTAEMGLRMALGARGGDVVRLVVGQELLAVGAGLLAGVVVSVAMGRVLESVLYEVSPLDVGAYVAAAGALLGLSIAAALIPARKAARSDPVTALKAE
jgi:ABC-type antimicrobial peptide transport system permease subunit